MRELGVTEGDGSAIWKVAMTDPGNREIRVTSVNEMPMETAMLFWSSDTRLL